MSASETTTRACFCRGFSGSLAHLSATASDCRHGEALRAEGRFDPLGVPTSLTCVRLLSISGRVYHRVFAAARCLRRKYSSSPSHGTVLSRPWSSPAPQRFATTVTATNRNRSLSSGFRETSNSKHQYDYIR